MPSSEEAASAVPATERPSHIIIEDPWRRHAAGKVFACDADMLRMLARDGVTYRPATDEERRIGGFPG